MMAIKKHEGTQLQLAPVVEADRKSKRENFLKENPSPNDLTSAEKFLRDHCEYGIFKTPDADWLELTLKFHNIRESKRNFKYEEELPLADEERRNEIIIETAQEIYDSWIDAALKKL